MSDDDEPLFADDAEEADSFDLEAIRPIPGAAKPWTVLVVDDDPEVLSITRVVLGELLYRDRPLRLLYAASEQEARGLLAEEPEVALILLDVVMETGDAGLRLVRHVRETLGDRRVRIVLRTGQPGQAPEQRVILEYEINDYRAKTELTAGKLVTTTVAALRAYEEIERVDRGRRGLERIAALTNAILRERDVSSLAKAALEAMAGYFEADGALLLGRKPGIAGVPSHDPCIITAVGRFAETRGLTMREQTPPEAWEAILEAMDEKAHRFAPAGWILCLPCQQRRELAIYLPATAAADELNRQLADVFCGKIAVGLDNMDLYERLRFAHEATVTALAEVAEYHEQDTTGHVQRVADLSGEIARHLRERALFFDQLTPDFLELLDTASTLHDIGKVAVSDAILGKPGPLDQAERAAMEEHSDIGAAILERASLWVDGDSYLGLGAEIARFHHERFDGTGYPEGLAGDQIPLPARIVALADVYDALIHKRPYKDAWPRPRAIAYIRDHAGSQFDPILVESFLAVVAAETVDA